MLVLNESLGARMTNDPTDRNHLYCVVDLQ